MMKGKKEGTLLERAGVEEKGYNWVKAAKLYEQAAKSFLEKKMVEEAAGTYKKLGYACYYAGRTAETAEEYVELNRRAIKAYKQAENLFEQSGDRSEKLECEAEALLSSGLVAASVMEAKKAFSKSYELFIESSELYSKEDDQESSARTLSRAAMTSDSLVNYCSDQREIEQVCQRGRDVADKAWKLSKEIGNIQSLAESLVAESGLIVHEMNIVTFRWDERWRKHFRKSLLRGDESLKLADGCDNLLVLGKIYLVTGSRYCGFATQFVEDEREQREYANKGFRLMEKALVFARKAKDKHGIISCLYWLDYHSFILGRFEYVQKRVFDDLLEIVELGKIYASSYSVWPRIFANLLPAFCYANFAQRSFFSPDQRKSYAEKGIEHARESLNTLSFPPFSAQLYQMLTWSHSQLALLASTMDERDEQAQKMLQYAKQAAKIAEKYEGGMSRAYGYSSLYRAYKTLADIAHNEEERIKMLTAAIDAHKKYIGHALESRTGVILVQMRLGLLYEELGITTGKTDPLMKARDSFLRVIKKSLERGYHFYTAAAHISAAHIEDRLGNHMASAEHYEKAQEAHVESLKTIEYRPLKDRIEEMINYARAWDLIEKAKAHHKREAHSEAKGNYEKACEILKELPSYDYEASYYSAWALQEEAEQLSKQERHKEAMEKYRTTKTSFDSAIKTLEKTSKQATEKGERKRIEKLEKVARVRMNYCSARANVERARILGKQGEHLAAAEKFGSAASQFRDVFTLLKIERERGELEAVYYLCRAWETMELAEKYEEPDRFAEAANLFMKASELFTDSKLKLLASGNSAFCQALEHGCKFDESTETHLKAQLYPKIKVILRKAAASYEKGGFENGADWALATSTYFDAVWHLIRADEELEIDKRRRLLGIGTRYLKSAAELFGKAGHRDKEREILVRLDRVKREEKILVSALNTIREPSISRSTVGIVAPASSVETSLSPRISEVRRFTEEARRVADEKVAKKKYELVYRDILKEYPGIERRECRVAIAQIGVSTTGDIISEFYEEKATGLLGIREEKVETVRSKIKNMIEIAHAKGVNILLFPELIVDLNYGQLLEDIASLAKAYEMYIIPGSYHEEETRRNVSVVVGPDGILWRQEKHIPATIHHEGKKFREGIEVGTVPRKTFVCDTGFGRIAIVICRDFLDMDLRVELKNFEPPVDLVFNPAFTPVTADFKAAHFDARRSIYAYCFFVNVAEFGDSLIYTPEKERVERTIPPREESLIYKDIDLFKLRSERKKWEKEQRKESRFIQSTR